MVKQLDRSSEARCIFAGPEMELVRRGARVPQTSAQETHKFFSFLEQHNVPVVIANSDHEDLGTRIEAMPSGIVVSYKACENAVSPRRMYSGACGERNGHLDGAELNKILVGNDMAFSLVQAVNILTSTKWDEHLELDSSKSNSFLIQGEKQKLLLLVAKWRSRFGCWDAHLSRFCAGRGNDRGSRLLVRN